MYEPFVSQRLVLRLAMLLVRTLYTRKVSYKSGNIRVFCQFLTYFPMKERSALQVFHLPKIILFVLLYFPQVQDNLLQNSVLKCFDTATSTLKPLE